MFTHGTKVRELESKLKVFAATQTPTVVIGTAAVNMGDVTCVNKPILIQSPKDAAKYFGTTNNIKGFTINEAIYLATNIYNTFPIIVINVCDPTKHKKQETESALVLKDGKIKLKHIGILIEGLNIQNTDNSTPITNSRYKVEFDANGILEIKVEELGVTKIDVTYNYLDPSMVTESDVIGSIDPQTLECKGLECVKEIFSKYSMVPSCVVAPDFATSKIALALDAKVQVINNKWLSFSVIELPKETKFGAAIEYKKANNNIDEDQIVFYGVPYIGDETFHGSIVAALHMQSVDAKNDGIPYESPSNKNIKMHGIGYYQDTTFKKISLDEVEANLLNENGICTIISRSNGTVFWGNRTSVYQPGGDTDPKNIWIPLKRMFKYIGNVLMLNNENEVDKPMTKSRAKSIETNASTWLASLVASEKLLGARVAFLPEDNNIMDMANGKFRWHIYLAPPIPGETLEFLLEYDGEYLKTLYK